MQNLEILEQEHGRDSIITPGEAIRAVRGDGIPAAARLPGRCILSFWPSLTGVLDRCFGPVRTETLNPSHPHRVFDFGPFPVAYVSPGMGAPLAALALEETLAAGSHTCVFVGPAGSLVPGLRRNDILLPTAAVRDEGTSFHYAPPDRFAHPDPGLVSGLRDAFRARNLAYREGTVWTTDAPFRETPGKAARLAEEGCLAVDMEAAALFAVAAFRGARLAGFFLAMDSIDGGRWTRRLPDPERPGTTPETALRIACECMAAAPRGRENPDETQR